MQKESSTEEPTLKVDPGFEPGLTEVFEGIKIWYNRKNLNLLNASGELTRCDTGITLANGRIMW
jgi:hypothetical protein